MSTFFKTGIAVIALVICATSIATSVSASSRGTPQEAIAMVKGAKALYAKHGIESLIKMVNEGTHGTRDRDLYVFIMHTKEGWMVAHPYKALRGLNITDLRDPNDVSYYRQHIKALGNKEGWARYVLINPVTKKNERKQVYVEFLNSEYYLGVGVYERLPDQEGD